jgi:hypothetical protein
MSDIQTYQDNPIPGLVTFLKRFVYLEREELYTLLALWIITTYFTDRFEYTGYIFAHSVLPQSGKSRLLELLDKLVQNSSDVLIRPTPAILFRTAHGHTQLLDEVDAWTNGDELRSILNAGFRRGAQVKRMGRSSDNSFKTDTFPVFAPRALAGIGTDILDSTTKDRTFAIQMIPQPKEFRRERLRMKGTMRAEIEALKHQFDAWAKERGDEIAVLYEDENAFNYLEDFRDRTIDVSQPLAAVLEVAYKGDEVLEAQRVNLIHAIARTRKEDASVVDDFKILKELKRLTTIEDPLIGTASELAKRCIGLPAIPEENNVSRTLRKFGFDKRSTRKPDGTPKHRYWLSGLELNDIVQKYGASSPTEFCTVVGVVGLTGDGHESSPNRE